MHVLFYSSEFGSQSPSGTASTEQPLAWNRQSMLVSSSRLSLASPRNYYVPPPDFYIQPKQ